MGYDLMVYNLDLQSRAERVANLQPDELRRKAVRAASEKDAAELWSIMESYLVTRGARGSRVSRHTLESYRQGLQVLLAFCAASSMSLLRPRGNEPFAFVRQLEASGLAPASVQSRLAAARCVYAALRWAGATDAAPFTDVRAARDPVPKTEKRGPYNDADLSKLLAKADPQQRLWILLGAHTGLRVSEMLSLRRADLHLNGDEPYLIVDGKGGKRQSVPVSPTLCAALKAWVAMTPQVGERVLAVTTRRAIEISLSKLCLEAGVEYGRKHVHGLRHSAGTRVYVETKDLLEVRDHLRHRDITSSEIYVEYARKGKPKVNRNW